MTARILSLVYVTSKKLSSKKNITSMDVTVLGDLSRLRWTKSKRLKSWKLN